MQKIPVIVIFDIGKTNKKLLLFNEQYQVVYELSQQFEEIKDEDGFACEDVDVLSKWIKNSFAALSDKDEFDIKAVNFSAYGASFVYVDNEGNVVVPMYNYLKPYPENLQHQFYQTYGGESSFAKLTASPVLGNLNSGMQLYFLKNERSELFKKVTYALHLPQYISYLFTNTPTTDITSIGCHTGLWNFQHHQYHQWVEAEQIDDLLAPLMPCSTVYPFRFNHKNYVAGIGLHDSSAALIPYLTAFSSPFILLSTGTWCISLNPFNNSELTEEELYQDCLCYLSYQGKNVKASRLFAGYEHEQQVKRIALHFNKPLDYFTSVRYDGTIKSSRLKDNSKNTEDNKPTLVSFSSFSDRSLNDFEQYEMAYHQLIFDLVQQQIISTNLVLKNTPVKRIFVDGGFSKNVIFMNMLAQTYSTIEIFAAAVPQASALGAAMVLHEYWNTCTLPSNIIDLKLYTSPKNTHI